MGLNDTEMLARWKALAEDTIKGEGVTEKRGMAETILELIAMVEKTRLVLAGTRLFEMNLHNGSDPVLEERDRLRSALRTAHYALERAERKLFAYAGVCKGDKELWTVIDLVRAPLLAANSEKGGER